MKLLAIDVETGGLDCRRHGITEIAAVACSFGPTWEGPTVMGRFSCLVRPADGLEYEEEALAIQRRTMADIEGGITERQAILDLHAFVSRMFGQNSGSRSPFAHVTPCAHNAQFDIGFIEQACKRQELAMPCNFLYRCSVQAFRLWSDARGETRFRFRLDDMMHAFGVAIPPDERHKASADVEAMAICYGHIMRDLARG